MKYEVYNVIFNKKINEVLNVNTSDVKNKFY